MAHESQKEFCEHVKKIFPDHFRGVRVLDIGSLDINGNNRYLFEDSTYIGIDLGEGPNVDVVAVAHEYEAPAGSFDTIISTEAFEHDMHLPKTLIRVGQLLRVGGLFLFTCATTGRTPHGVKEWHDFDSPFTAKIPEWENYYKNVTEEDIAKLLPLQEAFQMYAFDVEGTDLRFWGVKS